MQTSVFGAHRKDIGVPSKCSHKPMEEYLPETVFVADMKASDKQLDVLTFSLPTWVPKVSSIPLNKEIDSTSVMVCEI